MSNKKLRETEMLSYLKQGKGQSTLKEVSKATRQDNKKRHFQELFYFLR